MLTRRGLVQLDAEGHQERGGASSTSQAGRGLFTASGDYQNAGDSHQFADCRKQQIKHLDEAYVYLGPGAGLRSRNAADAKKAFVGLEKRS